MPLPPPPAAAFSRIGYPNFLATLAASFASANGSVVPGTTGTPFATARVRAAVLLPIAAIASAGGPIQTSPASQAPQELRRWSQSSRAPRPALLARTIRAPTETRTPGGSHPPRSALRHL